MSTTTAFVPGLLASAILCCSGHAQRTWKVSCNDPNAHFTDLPAAVAAANPGDTIWVYVLPPPAVGCTNNYSAAVIEKPLTILGFYPGYSAGWPNPSFEGFWGLFRIRGIPAGQRVVISNIALSYIPPAYTVAPIAPHGIYATDCDGDLVLEDWWYETYGAENPVVRFERCRNVVLRGCDLRLGGEPVTAIDSNVPVATTSIVEWPPVAAVPFR